MTEIQEIQQLPPFLRETFRYKHSSRHFRFFEGPGPIHVWREAELSISFEDLLDTDNASEILFEFLEYDVDNRVDPMVDGDDDHIFYYEDINIVWLSTGDNYTFLSKEPDLHCVPYFSAQHQQDFEIRRMFDFTVISMPQPKSPRPFTVYRMMSTLSSNSVMSTIVPAVDCLLLLLAKHSTVKEIKFLERDRQGLIDPGNRQPFTVSLHALETFVSEPQSPRTIGFDIPLTADQWQVITFNCTKNITLIFDDWYSGSGAPYCLIESMNLNQCPTKLVIRFAHFGYVQQEGFRAFTAALEANTSILELKLGLSSRAGFAESGSLLLDALSRKRGLQQLDLANIPNQLSDEQWEILCDGIIAHHPTIQNLFLSRECGSVWPNRSEARDQMLVNAVRYNTVLRQVECRHVVFNPQRVYEEILPDLKLNAFRPIVQLIKEEVDPAVRERKFVEVQVACTFKFSDCRSPSLFYWLLKENPDLFVSQLLS